MKATFVKKIKANKHDAFSFYFRPEKKLKFTAGQFTEISLVDYGAHWFTISSQPGQECFTITTRVRARRPFKQGLMKLAPGEEINMAEPMGDFVLPINSHRPVLMVAGGIGITPFLSILKDQLVRQEKYSLHLLYAVTIKEDLIDLKPYAKLLTSYKELIRRLEAEDILAAAEALNNPYIYISGPEKMVEKLIKQLRQHKIAEDRLIADYFPGY